MSLTEKNKKFTNPILRMNVHRHTTRTENLGASV